MRLSHNFWLIFLLALAAACDTPNTAQNESVSNASHGAVATAHPLATEVGAQILRNGGNAFDAAVAIHYALAVVYPVAGNIGGGGFAVIYHQNKTAALDFRETAPASAHRDLYLDSSGNANANLSRHGHLAVGVPGSVAGMQELHESLGALPFRDVIQPAIDLARDGYLLTEFGADQLNRYQEAFLKYNSHTPFVVKNAPWNSGDRFQSTDLATTLQRIQQNGRDGFYTGETARLIVEEMERGGGLITEGDLQNYRAVWRKPIQVRYKDYEVISMPPPSSGGIALTQLLMGSAPFQFSAHAHNSVYPVHHMTELMRRVYADRATHLGDSDFYPVPVNMLLDSAYVADRNASIDSQRATPSNEIKEGEVLQIESYQTTHFSVIDQWGSAIAVTTTLNSYFGSKVVVQGAGFFLNNEMDDFSAQPGVPNQFGLLGGEANAIAPGKRMLSSMTPTIVTKDGELQLVLGTPGGSTIITNVYQVLLNVVEYNMDLQSAVNAKKIHAQWLPDEITVEDGALKSKTMDSLRAMGHELNFISQIGRFNAVGVLPNGSYTAASDTGRTGDATGLAW